MSPSRVPITRVHLSDTHLPGMNGPLAAATILDVLDLPSTRAVLSVFLSDFYGSDATPLNCMMYLIP